MTPSVRFALLWAACIALCAAAVAAFALTIYHALPEPQQRLAAELMQASGDLPYLLAAILVAATGFAAVALNRSYFLPLRRMAECVGLINNANAQYRLAPEGPFELRSLAQTVNVLADRHAAALLEIDRRIADARAALESEKNRLAVLMSELAQSVIVLNPEGRILLYNEQARRLFANTGAQSGGSGPGFIGLGRSIYTVLARAPIQHAIDRLIARSAAGEIDPIVVFTTVGPGGVLMRVRIAPMAGHVQTADAAAPPAGFVLLLEDAAKEIGDIEQRDRILVDLVEQSRAALASLRAATENLAGYPDMEREQRMRFMGIAVEEAHRLTAAVEHAGRAHAEHGRRHPRALEAMRAADLIDVMCAGCAGTDDIHVRPGRVDAESWVNVDSHALVQALRYLARRLAAEFGVRALSVSASGGARHVFVDVAWHGVRLPAATVLDWEQDALSAGGEASSTTLREIVQQHGAEIWHEFERTSGDARFRIMLPVGAQALADAAAARKGRPVFYDFDLFAAGASTALDEMLLARLAYTVFDTETTGLDPSAGDEIIAIGAVRIVNGRVLPEEIFDQLIDPRRPVSAESVKVHGIRDEMLAGQPSIEQVLPAFQRFCADTVLVGHNVAFDMRFLQLKEQATGIEFRQPVLDTLLLSAVLHASIGDDRLEAIAHRLGIEVVARHNAVGDAIVTAEIFLKMIPLLAERGIHTLADARLAAERTPYAKLRY